MFSYHGVLAGVRCDVFESPLYVLVHSELPGERPGCLAAHAQDAVIRG